MLLGVLLGAAGTAGVLVSLGMALLLCVVSQEKPGTKLEWGILSGVIFVCSAACLLLVVRQTRRQGGDWQAGEELAESNPSEKHEQPAPVALANVPGRQGRSGPALANDRREVLAQGSYDSSWETDDDSESFERKCEEWEKRDWGAWLGRHLTFPFKVRRAENMDEDSFETKGGSFSVGQRMRVTGLAEESFPEGFLVFVEAQGQTGYIPLADVEVTDKRDPNYWPVKEYVVWMANH